LHDIINKEKNSLSTKISDIDRNQYKYPKEVFNDNDILNTKINDLIIKSITNLSIDLSSILIDNLSIIDKDCHEKLVEIISKKNGKLNDIDNSVTGFSIKVPGMDLSLTEPIEMYFRGNAKLFNNDDIDLPFDIEMNIYPFLCKKFHEVK